MTANQIIERPTRADMDTAYDRLAGVAEENPLQVMTDLITLGNYIAVLTKVLDFYANRENHRMFWTGAIYTTHYQDDNGHCARAALGIEDDR